MLNNSFFKFPSTPHLIVLDEKDIRDDKILDHQELQNFMKHNLIVEEKADGANLGISFDANGNIRLQNRASYIYRPYIGQWTMLEKWLETKIDILFDALGDQYIMFGEWCYAEHTVAYNNLPDWFLGFDIYDKTNRAFLSYSRRNEIISNCNIAIIPLISIGVFAIDNLVQMLDLPSKLGNNPPEGLYLRYDDGLWLCGRAKIVRRKFIQTDDEHWSRKKLIKNTKTFI